MCLQCGNLGSKKTEATERRLTTACGGGREQRLTRMPVGLAAPLMRDVR